MGLTQRDTSQIYNFEQLDNTARAFHADQALWPFTTGFGLVPCPQIPEVRVGNTDVDIEQERSRVTADQPHEEARTVRQRRIFLVAALAAGLGAVGGLAASTLIKSPAQRAAETAAPKPSVLTAPVVRKVLQNVQTLRGTVTAGAYLNVGPQTFSSSDNKIAAIVSKVYVKTGDQISAGQVLVEVSGQPIVVMSGAVPMYRDLKLGSVGGDVTELQTALAALGFTCHPDASGTFGTGTETAVAAYFAHIGYSAPTTGGAGAGASAPMVPAGEIVFAPTFPLRVAASNAALGSTASTPLLTLDAGNLVVGSLLQAGQNTMVKPGMKVQLDAEGLGDQTATGSVTSLGPLNSSATKQPTDANAPQGSEQSGGQNSASGTPDGTGSHQPLGPQGNGYPMTITPDAPLPATWTGQDVRVTIVDAATSAPVLSVPLSAVSTGADGQSSVSVLKTDGRQSRVLVVAGVSADGDVQVTPVAPAQLHEGDAVVIGQAGQ